MFRAPGRVTDQAAAFIRNVALTMLAVSLHACSTSEAQPRINTSLAAVMDSQGFQTIHLQRLPSYHDLIDATINGVKGRFIVDTGASFSVIHTPRASAFQLNSSDALGTQSATMPTGNINLTRYRLRSIAISSRAYHLPEITSADLGALAGVVKQTSGQEIDGIIGQDFLIRNQAIIDVGARRIYLRAP